MTEVRSHSPGTARPRQFGSAGLLLRTVVHLRPMQIFMRMRLRALRLLERRWPGLVTRAVAPLDGMEARWPSEFRCIEVELDHGIAEEICRGRFTFLNESRSLGAPADWSQDLAPQLWRYNLHYFEWAWALGQMEDRNFARTTFASLWLSWREGTRFPRGDAWSPYVVSLRAWVLCSMFESLIKGTEIEADVLEQLGLHAGYLRSHLEFDVGGNHLVKNLKALVGVGIFLGRQDLVSFARTHLVKQAKVQVLNDGGHYERSAAYHCQVLADFIDVQGLIAAAGGAPISQLDAACRAMRTWLGAMVAPDGEVVRCNDSFPVGPARIHALQPPAHPPGILVVLESSGYVVIRADDRSYVVVDVGDPCPPDLPAHAHADCLSVTLWVDGQAWLLDSGTSTYIAGPRRDYERSTSAHSTVRIDGCDQTEVWGAFRAARLARGSLLRADVKEGVVEVVASHDGFRHLRGKPVHERRVVVAPGNLAIFDRIHGGGRHEVTSFLLANPSVADHCAFLGPESTLRWDRADVASDFGVLQTATRACARLAPTKLPVEIGWRVTWGAG